MVNEQNYPYNQPVVVRSETNSVGLALLGAIALGIGGVGLWYALKNRESGYGVNAKAGWGGVWLGGPSGLGILSYPTVKTGVSQFDSQHLFYVAEWDKHQILIDEVGTIWLTDLPVRTNSKGFIPVKEIPYGSTEWTDMIKSIAEKNEQQVLGNRLPCAEYNTYLTDPVYDNPTEFAVYFPVPLNDGKDSLNAAWRLEKGWVRIEVAKNMVGQRKKRTGNVRVTVSSPTFGEWSYIQPGKKGATRATFNDVDAIGDGLKALKASIDSKPNQCAYLGGSTQNITDANAKKLRKVIEFWNNSSNGIYGGGWRALHALGSGLAGLRGNEVSFGRGNFYNSSIDVLEVARIFELLCMAPKATVILNRYTETTVDRSILTWLANVTESGVARDSGSLVYPKDYHPLITSEAFIEDLKQKGLEDYESETSSEDSNSSGLIIKSRH